jgi:hypothetical protein
MESIRAKQATPIDDTWYRQLKPLIDELGETFVALMPSERRVDQLRNAFDRSDYQATPDLRPDSGGTEEFEALLGRLEELRTAIHDTENNQTVKELYVARIEELQLNAKMIIAAKTGDTKAFNDTNQRIYGMPNSDIFASACQWIRAQAKNETIPVSQQLRERVLDVVPDVSGSVNMIPPDDVFQRVRTLHFTPGGYVAQLFDGINLDNRSLYTAKNADEIVRQVIRNVGSDYTIADSPVGLWAVLQSQQQVIRPSNFRLTKPAFMGIVSHEVGSHLLEATNGSRSRLHLLESGLDHYEAGNEGRAFLREQIMYERIEDYIDQREWSPTKASWEYRVAIHMAVSLAAGLYGRRYNFVEIYHLLLVLFEFWTAKRGVRVDERVVADGAWSMAVRALKGTDGRGGAYYKDIVYLEGNVRCWQEVAMQPTLILWGDIGKFDIANGRHITALRDLGVLPTFTDTLDS